MARRHYDDEPIHDDVHDEPLPRRRDEFEREDVYAEDATVAHGGFLSDLPGRINTVIFAALTAVEALLALRFLLLAFGANQNNGFVDFVMDLSWPFVRPFDGAFANRTWDEGLIEVSTLLAMGVWFLLAAVVMLLVSAIVPRVYTDDGGTRYHRRRVTHSG